MGNFQKDEISKWTDNTQGNICDISIQEDEDSEDEEIAYFPFKYLQIIYINWPINNKIKLKLSIPLFDG